MMYFYRLFLFSIIFLFPVSLISQPLEWMEITDDYELPEGLRFFGHSFEDSNIEAWYLELDLNENGLAVEAIPGSDFQSISDYDDKEGVYAAVNGGYFAGEDVVSAVVTPDGDVPTRNIATLNRDGNTHHVTRSMFSLDDEIKPSVDWIYHHGLNVDDIYRLMLMISTGMRNHFPTLRVNRRSHHRQWMTVKSWRVWQPASAAGRF